VEYCIENGIPLMIENLQDDIDAVLDPVVARQTTKRGRNTVMKLGDKEAGLTLVHFPAQPGYTSPCPPV
jgi:dynein heavy chain